MIESLRQEYNDTELTDKEIISTNEKIIYDNEIGLLFYKDI